MRKSSEGPRLVPARPPADKLPSMASQILREPHPANHALACRSPIRCTTISNLQLRSSLIFHHSVSGYVFFYADFPATPKVIYLFHYRLIHRGRAPLSTVRVAAWRQRSDTRVRIYFACRCSYCASAWPRSRLVMARFQAKLLAQANLIIQTRLISGGQMRYIGISMVV